MANNEVLPSGWAQADSLVIDRLDCSNDEWNYFVTSVLSTLRPQLSRLGFDTNCIEAGKPSPITLSKLPSIQSLPLALEESKTIGEILNAWRTAIQVTVPQN